VQSIRQMNLNLNLKNLSVYSECTIMCKRKLDNSIEKAFSLSDLAIPLLTSRTT
jgi:hypothetical protein